MSDNIRIEGSEDGRFVVIEERPVTKIIEVEIAAFIDQRDAQLFVDAKNIGAEVLNEPEDDVSAVVVAMRTSKTLADAVEVVTGERPEDDAPVPHETPDMAEPSPEPAPEKERTVYDPRVFTKEEVDEAIERNGKGESLVLIADSMGGKSWHKLRSLIANRKKKAAPPPQKERVCADSDCDNVFEPDGPTDNFCDSCTLRRLVEKANA